MGLKRAGFTVVLGVEIDAEIVKTYKANHPEVGVLTKDVRDVTGKEILDAAGVNNVDLVAGCPPCQGFSKLTAKCRKEDPRNDLVLEMARIVKELKPSMVMMENVAGLADRGKARLDKFVKILESMGYVANHRILQLADYGVPQSRRRLVLLAGKGFRIEIPKATHCRAGDGTKGLKPRLTLLSVLEGLDRPVTLSQANRKGGPKKFNWHVVRDLKGVSLRRLKALRPGDNRSSLPKRLRPRCHANGDKGFENVYGRLRWNQVPPTITSGCTTLCMGRFGHPSQTRTISVREAALIQTFPKSYRLDTDYMETACNLVGNALPPKFARVVGKACLKSFLNNGGGLA